LGLPADASAEGVKSAFRRLAKTLHPDLHPAAPDAHRDELSRRLAGVTAAYAALNASER
jgi:curved DNA-binding protein CbpA